MLRSVALTVGAAAASVLLVSCSQPGPDTGEAAPPTEAAPSSTPTGRPVDKPLDLKAVADPCQLLTPEQLASFGLDDVEPVIETLPWDEKACTWDSSDIGITFDPNTVTGGGISRIQENQDNFDNYAETTVAGYPGAQVNANELLCAVTIGTSGNDTLTADVGYYSTIEAAPGDPCDLAKRAITEAVKNVPPQP